MLRHPILWLLATLAVFWIVVSGMMLVDAVTWQRMWEDQLPLWSETVAAWVGAVGSALAIFSGVILWYIDRRRAKSDELREHRARLQRLIAALRVEVESTIELSRTREQTAAHVIKVLKDAVSQGRNVTRGTVPPGAVNLTDAIVYGQVVSELGYLPIQLVRELVNFYGVAKEVARLAELSTSIEEACSILLEMTPRVQMRGLMLIRLIDTFERSGFSPDVRFEPTQQEMLAMVNASGYPLEKVLKERGLTISPARRAE